MMKHKKLVVCVCLVAIVALCSVLFFMSKNRTTEKNAQLTNETKAADAYTWEEYQAMSPEEQDAFFHRFASVEAFEAWKESVKPNENDVVDLHWNKEGKQPDEYTWEEYQALTLEEQEAFYQWFESEAAFEAWMESAKPNEEKPAIPNWNKDGKLPNEYTWEEYQALKPEEQEAFFLWFASESDFDAWKDAVKPAEPTTAVLRWNKSKLPSEYTWEEYQALKGDEQEAFFQWFGSVSAFETWMQSVKPKESVPPVMGWNKPGKRPDEYTWEEYQALSVEEQESFYRWFGSATAFEAWMKTVRGTEDAPTEVTWDKPGKKPDEYTWAEYQVLSPEEQDAFYNWFGSVEAFETWMKSVKENESEPTGTSWNKPGKKPNEYTWAEYQALNPEDQELFYKWFASIDAFEAWMESARSASTGSIWNKPGKKPDQYTKEEYLALTPEEQDAFFQWFETLEAFEAWVDKVENQ